MKPSLISNQVPSVRCTNSGKCALYHSVSKLLGAPDWGLQVRHATEHVHNLLHLSFTYVRARWNASKGSLFYNSYLVTSRNALALELGIERDQTTAPKDPKVSVVPMHFIFAQKFFLYSRDNGPQKTCVRSDKVGFFPFLLRRSNAIFSLF